MGTRERGGAGSEEAVMRLVQEHAAELLRFARRFSHCADDAHDAYQRSLEILVRRMRTDPPSQPLPWLKTVLRHEALAVRTQRSKLVDRVEVDFDRHEGDPQEDPAERAVANEHLRQTAEALKRLKPQEVTALVLRAEGLSYKEICDRTGWTYTRCNRAVTEGRRALLERLGAIKSGAECARWLPLLSLLADGEATAAQLAELRLHLRGCPACRATLRTFHAAPAKVAVLVPPILVPLAASAASGGSLLGHVELALHAFGERVTRAALRVQGAVEAMPGAKLAAVAASSAALAGGGAALDRVDRATDAPPAHAAAAPVTSTSATVPLTTLAASFPQSARPRREAPRARRSEFAPPTAAASASEPEFASRDPPPAEFRAEPPEAAVVAAAPAPVPTAPTPPPAEFAAP
jgi:RNA polymerase sigma factor (sigma-70 family)